MVARKARARADKVLAERPVWSVSSATNDSEALPEPTLAKSDRMRSFISHAALLVKVSAKTCRNARGSSTAKQQARYRLTKRYVLPLPAEARTTSNDLGDFMVMNVAQDGQLLVQIRGSNVA